MVVSPMSSEDRPRRSGCPWWSGCESPPPGSQRVICRSGVCPGIDAGWKVQKFTFPHLYNKNRTASSCLSLLGFSDCISFLPSVPRSRAAHLCAS